ncbi:hypothetical protein B0T20DRAFT_498351 [Sordaria brevicollis]|uniref:Uncharacterized protein n=1 Tax=Sordaria brevicollis TaxID=83679 RepID=A0AAE0UCH9_SORBR|nr:hypothetical protein B0T20DRAFT_498351 [Sordaria brevicollis]
MPQLTRRSSESCPPDPARYPRSRRSTRQNDEKSQRSDRRQSSPALSQRRRENRRSTSVVSNESRFSTIDEDHKDDPESDYHPRDVYYLNHPHGGDDDKDEVKSQWDVDLEAGDPAPTKQRDVYDDEVRSNYSRRRVPRPSTIVRQPSTIGTLSPRTRSPVDRNRRQSMRSEYLYGRDDRRTGSARSRPARELYYDASDSDTAVSPRTLRRRSQHSNRSPTPPHRGSVLHDDYYSRPRPRSNTFHEHNYTDDDTYPDKPRRDNPYDRPSRHSLSDRYDQYDHPRAHSNPPPPSRRPPPSTKSRPRRPSLSTTLSNLKDLKKSSPKTASLLKAASRALEAGTATALKLHKDSTPLFSAQSGSKIAAAALGAAVVDGLIEHEHRRHPKLMRKGGLRHHVVKQVVQRGVAGLVGGIIEEGLTGGASAAAAVKEEDKKEKKGRKETVKKVVKGVVRDYERWEKGDKAGHSEKDERKGGKDDRGRERRRDEGGRRGSERERDTDEEGWRERTRDRERGREGSLM